MRVIFMGTPDFAVPSLQALLDNGYEIPAVFTQPDKPKGRGHKLLPPPVKELALEYGIEVFQPKTLRDKAVQQTLRDLKPDAIVVAAYGKILPKAVLELPQLGCVNVHGSLLPRYRGAAPIQWAVLNGETVTGITTMMMADGIDTGDILLKEETEIGENETAGELFDRLKEIGAGLLLKTLEGLEQGTLQGIPQRGEDATLAPMLTKEQARIDWTQPADRIHNQIRGLNPWPCAFASLQGKKMKLFASHVVSETSGGPGEIRNVQGDFLVCCGQGTLKLTELQPENGKRMTGKSFLLGHPIADGAKFDEN